MKRLAALMMLVLALMIAGAALAQTESPSAADAVTPSPTMTMTQTPRGRGLLAATAVPTALEPTQSAPVASAEACDAGALRVWLTTQQSALQVSANLFDSSAARDANAVINDLLKQLSSVESRPRPACADAAMNWTYYVFATWIQAATCRAEPSVACQAGVASRAKIYLNHVKSFYAPLLEQSGLSATDLVDLSADDFVAGAAMTPTPTATPTIAPTATTPHKAPPHAQTPQPPTPNSNRGNGGVANGPEARSIRGAIASTLMASRVQGVLIINAEDFGEIRGLMSGRGVIVALTVSAAQQAAYTTDSILLMETVASAIQNQQLDLGFLIIVSYDPGTQNFSKASMVSIRDVLDYQAGRITRDQLLAAIRTVDDNQLPQV